MTLERYEPNSRASERVTEIAARAKRAESLWTELEKFEREDMQRSGYKVVLQLIRMKSESFDGNEDGWEWTVSISGRRVAKKKKKISDG